MFSKYKLRNLPPAKVSEWAFKLCLIYEEIKSQVPQEMHELINQLQAARERNDYKTMKQICIDISKLAIDNSSEIA